MPFGLLKYGLSAKYPARRHFPKAKDLKPAYDVVIVGAGGHGLAAAYYLAKDWGITNIAVLDKGYLAGGNTARNTAIIRSNYLTPDGVRFYDESVRLYQGLSEEFDYNIMYSVRGHFTLSHPGGALPPAGRHRAPRRGRLGLCPICRRSWRRDPYQHRGHRLHHRERPRKRRGDRPRAHSLQQGAAGGGRLQQPGLRPCRIPPAHPHHSAAGLRLRAAETLP